MNFENPILVAVVGLVVVGAVGWIVAHFISPKARLERRRRRSNARVTSNAKQPSVKFSVRTPQSKPD